MENFLFVRYAGKALWPLYVPWIVTVVCTMNCDHCLCHGLWSSYVPWIVTIVCAMDCGHCLCHGLWSLFVPWIVVIACALDCGHCLHHGLWLSFVDEVCGWGLWWCYVVMLCGRWFAIARYYKVVWKRRLSPRLSIRVPPGLQSLRSWPSNGPNELELSFFYTTAAILRESKIYFYKEFI